MEVFSKHGKDTYLIELEASLEVRLERNIDTFRLAKKPLKRNIERSETHLLHDAKHHRLNSYPGEITHPQYLRIDNTHLSA
jgi:hypothetical protein